MDILFPDEEILRRRGAILGLLVERMHNPNAEFLPHLDHNSLLLSKHLLKEWIRFSSRE